MVKKPVPTERDIDRYHAMYQNWTTRSESSRYGIRKVVEAAMYLAIMRATKENIK